MNNKKVGITFLILSIILAVIIIQLMGGLTTKARDIGCFNNEGCIKIESNLSLAHIAFGVIGFIFALGFYLIFFSKGEEAILKRLEENKRNNLNEQKFNLVLKGLDNYEKAVMKAVKEQEGITQNTLRIRTNMSKAKLSYVVNGLEKKELIKRIKKGKTLAIYLKDIFDK
jgi:uncharacterized membrane protein